MGNTKKRKSYSQLVTERKQCNICTGLTNPSMVDRGCNDSEHIGPWSCWQGNLDAELMIVGQDWGDVRYFRDNGGLDADRNPTNQTLMRLLKHIGVEIGSPRSESNRHRVFFTNAILCLKEGGLQATVETDWFTNCSGFLRRQIEIISPTVVVTLGYRALSAVRDAFDLEKIKLADAVNDQNGSILFGNTHLLAAYHPGRRVLNTHRPLNVQKKDWKRIGRVLQKQQTT